jgi:hypothetical protein
MSCADFTPTSPNCRTVTLIEPDQTLTSSLSSGSTDQSLEEHGTVILVTGQARVDVTFVTAKVTEGYRFEYMYVEIIGENHPANVEPVLMAKTRFGFTVKFAGWPIEPVTPGTAYVFRWRVVVVRLDITDFSDINAPESLYLPLPIGARTFTATFVNPRDHTNYGFTELRVENLVDADATQRVILAQVVTKTLNNFTVALSPPANTINYRLVARTP